MTDNAPDLGLPEVRGSLWTGRMEFDLLNGRGWRIATIEMVIRIESITLWSANRTLAVMDRDLFGAWLFRPEQVLEIDDVAWSVQGAHTCITIDAARSYVVPEPTVEHLREVV